MASKLMLRLCLFLALFSGIAGLYTIDETRTYRDGTTEERPELTPYSMYKISIKSLFTASLIFVVVSFLTCDEKDSNDRKRDEERKTILRLLTSIEQKLGTNTDTTIPADTEQTKEKTWLDRHVDLPHKGCFRITLYIILGIALIAVAGSILGMLMAL